MKLNSSYQQGSSIVLSEMEFQITAQAFRQTDNYNANIQVPVSQRGWEAIFLYLFLCNFVHSARKEENSMENFSNFLLQKRTIVSSVTIILLTRCNLL